MQLLQCCSSLKALSTTKINSLYKYIFIYIYIEIFPRLSHDLFWNCNTATLQQREQNGARSSYAERQQPRRSQRCNSENRDLVKLLMSRGLQVSNESKVAGKRSPVISSVCHLEPVERSPEISPCAVIPRGSPCVVPTI